MRKRKRTREDWRREVFRSKSIKDNVRVLLLFLAEHLGADMTVSVPRKTIATQLGKSERRISERITAAHRAGFLYTVSPGYVGRTAVYQATFPDVLREGDMSAPSPGQESGTILSPLPGAESRPLSERERGRHGRPPLLERTRSVSGHDRDGRSNEEHMPTSVASRLPCAVCEYDGCSHCEGER